MINPLITAKIFSTLGNNSSLIPLGIKDISNTLGMTAGSYVTGSNVEGKDRFIDEVGTLFIWLLGIPFFKKVIDKTVFKIAKFNPNIDVRLLKNQEIFEKAKKHAVPTLKAGFERIEKNQKLFKGLTLAKFMASTALTLASYSALTTFRHKHTEKTIIKEFKKEAEKKKELEAFSGKKSLEKTNQKNPNFGMSMNILNQFMFDPVKNTMIIDGGITTERLAESRNPQDFLGYLVKEGGFWTFMYFAGPAIQKYLEKKAAQNHKPIDLDIRVLQDEKLKKAFFDKTIEQHIKEFSIKGTEAQIYESLFDKNNNLIVQMAKKSNIIKTIKNSEEIDTQHFVNINEIKGVKEKIEKLYKEFSSQSKYNLDDFFKEIIKLKRKSIIKNIGFSIGALGVIVPGIMVAMRYLNKDNKEFQVKKEIHERLKKEQNAE